MTGLYVPEILAILRDGGLTVEEIYGWENLARSSGGFDNNRVDGIIIHHDASSPISVPHNAAIYTSYGTPIAPLANLYLDRRGVWWCTAAGAVNSAGSGGPWHTIPKDDANRRVLAIEIANNGLGEAYSIDQQLSLRHGVALLWNNFAARFDWGVETWRIFGHYEWAPDRKFDPAGPSIWTHETDRYKKWDMIRFRQDIIAHAISLLPRPEPQPEQDLIPVSDGTYLVLKGDSPWGVATKVYGVGSQYPTLTETNVGMWHPDDRIDIPGIAGWIASVKSGEGPYSIIRRAGLTPNTETLKDFYLFNGGQNHTIQPGEKVFIKKP